MYNKYWAYMTRTEIQDYTQCKIIYSFAIPLFILSFYYLVLRSLWVENQVSYRIKTHMAAHFLTRWVLPGVMGILLCGFFLLLVCKRSSSRRSCLENRWTACMSWTVPCTSISCCQSRDLDCL